MRSLRVPRHCDVNPGSLEVSVARLSKGPCAGSHGGDKEALTRVIHTSVHTMVSARAAVTHPQHNPSEREQTYCL